MRGIIHCHAQHHHHQHHHHCQHHQDAHYGETGGCLVSTMVNTMVSGEHARIKTLLSCYTQRAIIVTISPCNMQRVIIIFIAVIILLIMFQCLMQRDSKALLSSSSDDLCFLQRGSECGFVCFNNELKYFNQKSLSNVKGRCFLEEI